MKFLKSLAVVLALVIIAAVALLWSGILPYKLYVMKTGSMTPTIPSESLVVVHEGHYRVGQVISFRVNGGVVTHRLIGIKPDGTIVTKGDANPTPDPWQLKESSIIGGVVAAPKYIGFYLKYLETPIGATLVVVAVVSAWILCDAIERETKRKKLSDASIYSDPTFVKIPSGKY